MRLYRFFEDGIPWYLARHYWWAYLWPASVWFFDFQPIINAILFGQYKTLMRATLKRIDAAPKGRALQLSCVYGMLTPELARRVKPAALHIADAALVQLNLAKSKVANPAPMLATRMNAESLGYADASFALVVLFFLFHEMPADARRRVYAETLRVTQPGGVVLITEYAALPAEHWLYRFPPTRWALTTFEPFLDGFWREDMDSLLDELAAEQGITVEKISQEQVFSSFYRVCEYRVGA